MNPKSGRTIPLYFKVSPEEKELIDKKMEQLGTHNQRAYLRKMAVDGYVVRVDMTELLPSNLASRTKPLEIIRENGK